MKTQTNQNIGGSVLILVSEAGWWWWGLLTCKGAQHTVNEFKDSKNDINYLFYIKNGTIWHKNSDHESDTGTLSSPTGYVPDKKLNNVIVDVRSQLQTTATYSQIWSIFLHQFNFLYSVWLVKNVKWIWECTVANFGKESHFLSLDIDWLVDG